MQTNIIYNENCIDGLNSLTGECDLILTDPPYNISKEGCFKGMKGYYGIDFGEWDKGFDLTSWIKPATDKLRAGGSIVVFNAWQNIDKIAVELENCGLTPKEMIQWQKTNPMPKNRDRLYVTTCEFAVWAVKGKGWTFNRQRSNFENTIFQYPIVSASDRLHPTQKPVELMCDLIKIHSNKGDIVLDPFIGSGTTAVAALSTGRKYIGYEIDEKYYTSAKKRISLCPRKFVGL